MEVNRTDDQFRHVRFEITQLRRGEHRVVDTIFVEAVSVRYPLIKALRCTEAVQPAGWCTTL